VSAQGLNVDLIRTLDIVQIGVEPDIIEKVRLACSERKTRNVMPIDEIRDSHPDAV